MPMSLTMARHAPLATAVPAKSMVSLDWISQSSSMPGTSSDLFTATDSPVREACSRRRVAVLRCRTLMSAGTLSPTRSCTMSPGTSSFAGRSFTQVPFRRVLAESLCISLRASRALSALLSCQTPTTALMTRIRTMTRGSMYARMPPWPSSSMAARINEMPAARRRIFTRASSNCSRTSFHRGLPASFSSSFHPYFSRWAKTCSSVRPRSTSTPWCAATWVVVRAHAGNFSPAIGSASFLGRFDTL
mmetsp:Transcript_40615/g.129542  ORF Transcript_40615/g.129542 Transcript_40615/m.129542 type:complete len:246 (-) Transcript_40615:30-767(-)